MMRRKSKTVKTKTVIRKSGRVNEAQEQASLASAHGSARSYLVYGHAFVPMKVQIKIEADSPEAAMKAANKKLKTKIRDHLITGSEDEGAAFGFDATDAEEIKVPNGELSDRASKT